MPESEPCPYSADKNMSNIEIRTNPIYKCPFCNSINFYIVINKKDEKLDIVCFACRQAFLYIPIPDNFNILTDEALRIANSVKSKRKIQ